MPKLVDTQVVRWRQLASLSLGLGWLLLSACEPYKAHHPTLYNATIFPISVRIWSGSVRCGGAADRDDFRLRSCVELSPDGYFPLPGEYDDGDRCEVAVVESAGLSTTALYWDWEPERREGFGHPDDETVYLERVGERLFLESSPRITAEIVGWELPEATCPGELP